MTHGPATRHSVALRTLRIPRSAALAAIVLGMVSVFAACYDQTPTAPTTGLTPRGISHDVAPPANVEFYIHAAPVGWQLFMGNATVASLKTGHTVVMVHTTAGDGGKPAAFWQARESAALASADAVLGPGTWACAPSAVNGHDLRRCARANAVVYFMRMPDGNSIDGVGYGFGSLSRLRDLGATTSAVDGSASYGSWVDFINTIHALVGAEAAGQLPSAVELHAPEYDRSINPGDHPDSWATADAVQAAIQGSGWTGAWYVGYHTASLAANLSSTDLAAKQQVWTAYDNVMTAAGFASELNDPALTAMSQRTYFRVTATAPGIPSALAATATGKGRITVQWTDNSADENGFYVERASGVNGVSGPYAQIGIVDGNAMGYVDLTVDPSTQYFYRVRAFSDGGVSPYSNIGTATTPAMNELPYRADAYVMAHEDDWEIFAGDQAYSSLKNASAVLFVYLTAGDNGRDPAFWQAREQAARAAVDAIIGAGAWTCASRTVRTHAVNRCSKGGVVSYFLRLPDGNYIDGLGFGYGSMTRLRDQGMVITTRDGASTYSTWPDVYNTVSSIITSELSSQEAPYLHVYTHEYVKTLDPGDHPDHNITGDAVQAAAATQHWVLHSYVGYDTENRPVNISAAQHAQKMLSFNAYSSSMVSAGYESDAGLSAYQAWLARTYGRVALPASTSLTGPTNIAAQAPSMTEIDVSWTDNSPDESGFLIERAPDANGAPGSFAQIDSVGANVTTYANPGLTVGTTYWYRVRAVNETGVSGYGDPASATTLAPAPGVAPSGLAGTVVSATEIDLTWSYTSTGPLLGFRIERAPDASGAPGTFAEIASVAAAARTFGDTTLTQLTTYWYRVRAYNSGGTSDYSTPISGRTLTGLPAAPSGLKVTALSQTSLALDWSDNSNNELGFQIEQAPDAGGKPGTFKWIVGVAANSPSWNVSGLTAGTIYWFRVRATYIDSSAYSNSASGTTLPPTPAAPSNLVGTPVSGSEIDLKWTDNSTNEASFQLQRAPDNAGVAGTYATIATLGANVTSYKSLGLAANTRYWYRVRATNAGGSSAYTVTNATTPIATPLAPTTLVAKATTAATTATITWTDNSADETGFRIEEAPDVAGVAGTYNEIGTVATNIKTFTATGLTGATKYWFRVRAYNSYGNSAYTNEGSMTTPLPTNLAVTSTTVSGVLTANLAWTAGVGAKVDVYRDGVRIKGGIANTGTTTDGARTAGATNVYQVCNIGFTDAANCSNAFPITF